MSENGWLRERLKTHAWITPGVERSDVMNAYALTLRDARIAGIPMVSEAEFVDAYREVTAAEWTVADRALLAEAKIAP